MYNQVFVFLLIEFYDHIFRWKQRVSEFILRNMLRKSWYSLSITLFKLVSTQTFFLLDIEDFLEIK